MINKENIMTNKTEHLLRKLIREELRRLKENDVSIERLFAILGHKVGKWSSVRPINPDNLPDIKKATSGMNLKTYKFNPNSSPLDNFTDTHHKDEQYFYANVKGIGLFMVDTQGYDYCRYIFRIK